MNIALERVKENEACMQLVPLVMEHAGTAESKFFALQILDELVKVRKRLT